MTYTLELTADDLKVLEMGLMEIPTKYGAPLIAKINEQIRQQVPPPKPDETLDH